MPSLVNAMVSFRTNDDDKNKETNVTVEVSDNQGELAARISDPFGLFDDQTTNGPFDLELIKREDKSMLQGGTAMLRIDPAGDDSWNFNFLLELHFDDSTTLTASADGLQLNEHQLQSQTFGISA
jgi:hypothetical protein